VDLKDQKAIDRKIKEVQNYVGLDGAQIFLIRPETSLDLDKFGKNVLHHNLEMPAVQFRGDENTWSAMLIKQDEFIDQSELLSFLQSEMMPIWQI
jgi:hypothetical protein